MLPPDAATADAEARLAEAEALARHILAADPGNADAHHALGLVRFQQGAFEDAVGCLEKALAADSARAETRNYLVRALDGHGQAQAEAGRIADAEAAFARALDLDPAYAPAQNHWGNARAAAGDSDGAMARYRAALAIDPDLAAAHNNLGNLLADRLEMAEAEAALRRAVALAPDFAQAHFNLSMALLMQGKFAEAWGEYEWRWKCPEFPSTWRDFAYPFWDGGDLAGRSLLVWSEQGVGDEIMFAGTLPDAAAAAGHLVIECNERFVPLFTRSFPGATVVARRDPPDPAIDAARPDYQIPMASLCRHFRRSAEAFPSEPGYYLLADAQKRDACRARYAALGPRNKPKNKTGRIVGISWRSGNPVKGPERSAPLELWDPILTQPGNVFVCLQYGDVAGEVAETEARTGVAIHRDEHVDPFASMDDWAAQVAAMDLVVSVDNSTIQVAGALGVPTFTLLSHVPEWRFGMDAGPTAEGHLWHPRMRVFRPPTPGDWDSVMNAAAAALLGFHTSTRSV